jgi:hypothetical protein
VSGSLTHREFHPELLSRRGELTAWGLAFVVGLAWFVFSQSKLSSPVAFPILEAFLLFSALSISLGNWVDRHTVIHLGQGGIEFENGLRKASLKWEEINKIKVYPSAWGKKVQVIGSQAYFSFRTLGEVKYLGASRGRMGFAEGELILQRLLEAAHLGDLKKLNAGYYYARD